MERRKVNLLFFVPYIFFRPFRLSLVPTICPWVSEDGSQSLWQCFEIKLSKSLAVIASMALKLFNFETLRTLYAANGQVSYEFKWFYR